MPFTRSGEMPQGPALPASIDSPAMRRAGRELLSLALIDARNHTLHLLALLEQAREQASLQAWPHSEELAGPPHWLAGQVGWFAECWIARNTRRALGPACPARPTRLASIEPQADRYWDPAQCPHGERWAPELPGLEATKAYLLETLEATLELLEKAAQDDAGLYFFRLALFLEDLRGEQLVQMAQTLGLPIGAELPPPYAAREAVWVPATRWQMGIGPGEGFAFAHERGVQEVELPEFEIDAQPVNWQQFVEFVDDGGYDRPELWSPEGWDWAQATGRRAPRHVEQIGAAHRHGGGGSVLQRRFGAATRAAGTHAAMHLSWWEAQAWARWAGRRLATEAEWEVAAHLSARRGFRWGGEVQEWTAGTLRPFAGFVADPWSLGGEFDPQPLFGQARMLRGASFAARARARSPSRRAFALPGQDAGFVGFRTCAL